MAYTSNAVAYRTPHRCNRTIDSKPRWKNKRPSGVKNEVLALIDEWVALARAFGKDQIHAKRLCEALQSKLQTLHEQLGDTANPLSADARWAVERQANRLERRVAALNRRTQTIRTQADQRTTMLEAMLNAHRLGVADSYDLASAKRGFDFWVAVEDRLFKVRSYQWAYKAREERRRWATHVGRMQAQVNII